MERVNHLLRWDYFFKCMCINKPALHLLQSWLEDLSHFDGKIVRDAVDVDNIYYSILINNLSMIKKWSLEIFEGRHKNLGWLDPNACGTPVLVPDQPVK